MLRASIVFFVIAILAVISGIYNLGGISFELGRLLLFLFLGLSIVGLMSTLITGSRSAGP